MPAFATTARSQNNSYRADTSRRSVEKKTPYCDVCFKKGLSKETYQSHYPRSKPGPDGVIVCPTILAAQCRYCGESGHWANERYCRAMQEDNLEREAREKDRRKEDMLAVKQARVAAMWEGKKQPSTTIKGVVRQNGFAGLSADDSDDESEEVTIAPVSATPAPTPAPVSAPIVSGSSWAKMAAKPAILIPPEVLTKEGWTVFARGIKYEKKPDEKPGLSMAEEEAMKILFERASAGYFDNSEEDW